MVRGLQHAVQTFPGRGTTIAARFSSSHQRTQARRITEGGILAAITVVLGWLSLYVPFVVLVLPAPMTLLIYRHGLASGLMAWVTAAVLTGVLMGGLGGVLMLATAGFTAVGLGLALRRHLSPGRVMGWALAGAFLALTVGLAISLWLLGVHPVESLVKLMQESLQGALDVYRRMGLDPEQLRLMEESQMGAIQLIRLLFPVMLLLSATLSAYANYWVVRLVLRRLGEALPWFGPFSRWGSTGLAPTILLAGMLLGAVRTPWPWLPTAAANLLALGAAVSLAQGLSVIWFFIERSESARALKVLAVATMFFLPLAWLVVVLLGAIEPWINLRRL